VVRPASPFAVSPFHVSTVYHSLLTNRYLTTRVIPFIAVGAVALCVALVIIVVSVMTGFLDMVKSSGKTLMGDVVIAAGGRGIPHYQRLLTMLASQPEVAAATPLVESFGMLKMPYGTTVHVQFWGIEPSFADVTDYRNTLIWKTTTPEQAERLAPDAPHHADPAAIVADAQALHDSRSNGPGVVMGVYVSDLNDRQRDGTYRPFAGPGGPWQWWMPAHTVTLSTFALDGGLSGENVESRVLPVINEFASGIFLIDDRRVFIPLAVGQAMLHLHEAELVSATEKDERGLPRVLGIDPARVTRVLVRARPGVTPVELREVVQACYQAFHQAVDEDPAVLVIPPPLGAMVNVQTWLEQQRDFIGPIEKERQLMQTLFSVVHLVCAGLVLAIFWAIVHEKTRDIGILRSIGASRLGVVWIFLRYGFVIGVLGAFAGLGLGYLVVHNINAIHDAMGDPPLWLIVVMFALGALAAAVTLAQARQGKLLPVVLGLILTPTLLGAAAVTLVIRHRGGIVMWDPTVYLFTHIPNTIDVGNALMTMAGAVVFSLIGAMVPAAKAADTDPVRALRYE
jgi:lipoprotein-releasing system permease protein